MSLTCVKNKTKQTNNKNTEWDKENRRYKGSRDQRAERFEGADCWLLICRTEPPAKAYGRPAEAGDLSDYNCLPELSEGGCRGSISKFKRLTTRCVKNTLMSSTVNVRCSGKGNKAYCVKLENCVCSPELPWVSVLVTHLSHSCDKQTN